MFVSSIVPWNKQSDHDAVTRNATSILRSTESHLEDQYDALVQKTRNTHSTVFIPKATFLKHIISSLEGDALQKSLLNEYGSAVEYHISVLCAGYPGLACKGRLIYIIQYLVTLHKPILKSDLVCTSSPIELQDTRSLSTRFSMRVLQLCDIAMYSRLHCTHTYRSVLLYSAG
jgi:hypothetical protein